MNAMKRPRDSGDEENGDHDNDLSASKFIKTSAKAQVQPSANVAKMMVSGCQQQKGGLHANIDIESLKKVLTAAELSNHLN
jgi:hypothetical protein